MTHWKRAALLGLLSWLIPFALAFPLFPLKRANPPLFDTLMNLIVVLTAGALLDLYFRGRRPAIREALLVGAAWLAINLLMDYPMFSYGPMRMTVASYYSEIGLAYLAIPAVALAAARMARA